MTNHMEPIETANSKQMTGANPELHPPETMTALAWRRFRRHPGAMVGAIILTILIL